MTTVLSSEVKHLIDRPNLAHPATLMPEGSPQSVPVWVGRESERPVVCTGEGSLKAKNTRRDPPGGDIDRGLRESLRRSPDSRTSRRSAA
jgi:hypothetical protein